MSKQEQTVDIEVFLGNTKLMEKTVWHVPQRGDMIKWELERFIVLRKIWDVDGDRIKVKIEVD